jgi:hypothetical protein
MKYALAYCSGGLLGLITSDAPKEITYNDGNKGTAWTGLQVTGGWIAGVGGDIGKRFFRAPGMPWSSRTPRIIARLDSAEGATLEEQLKTLAPALVAEGMTGGVLSEHTLPGVRSLTPWPRA